MTTEIRTHAYLYDLNVAPLWRDRFDQLFLEHVPLPTEGRVLLVECGTGGLALELAHALKDSGSVTATDHDEECLELARAKATTLRLENIRFVSEADFQAELVPNKFDWVIVDASLVPAARLEMMARSVHSAVAPDGRLAGYAITRGSFDEFFSVYWEALYECGLSESLNSQLESVLFQYPPLEEVEEQIRSAGYRNIQLFTTKEEFSFQTGEEFLTSPLIAQYRLDSWFQILPQPTDRERVESAVAAIIDRDRSGQTFEIGVKTALVLGNRQPEGIGRLKTKTEKMK